MKSDFVKLTTLYLNFPIILTFKPKHLLTSGNHGINFYKLVLRNMFVWRHTNEYCRYSYILLHTN